MTFLLDNRAARSPLGSAERSPRHLPAAALDTSVPALILKIGSYPLNYGGLGVARSLGRAGVRVSAVVEGRMTPLARSRYVRRAFRWATSGREPAADLLATLRWIGGQLEGRPLLIATDDEAATLVARHAADLRELFRFPESPPGMVEELASKRGLHEIASRLDVARPEAAFPRTFADLDAAADVIGFPLTVKNSRPWERLRRPAVSRTTCVASPAELRELTAGWREPFDVILQAHLPREHCEDWFFQGYFDREGGCLAGFTGRKYRSWPHEAGVTACGVLAPNPEVLRQSIGLCRALGYHGIADLDWRLDRRDGRFHLLDFNPRPGAHFRLFQDVGGLDVVRAMHLDLSCRPVVVQQAAVRRFVAGHLDPLARLAGRGGQVRPEQPPMMPGEVVEGAWWAPDDPAPAAAAMCWVGRAAAQHWRVSRATQPS